MAYILDYWGKGTNYHKDIDNLDSLKTVRLKSINEAFPLSLPHNRPSGTIMIGVTRSDKQSVYEKVIWDGR